MFNFAERRNRERLFVKWEAECRNTLGHSIAGTIRDANEDGFFFVPDEDMIDLDFFTEAQENMCPGDTITLTYARERGAAAEQREVRLCWKGESNEHSCEGLGFAALTRL